jgi:AraC family transcriptional regulator of adaptative response / DNA-3-methyladenine glycosylase II
LELDTAICERARLARDPRFDGRFFIGVLTTGIYCRPVCPARSPLSSNIRYFATASAAAEAGFRPCLRCRPETAPGSPAWRGTSATVSRALRLIEQGDADQSGVEKLADRLGVTSRHLRRLFLDQIGASPATVAATRRLQLAKRLIDETPLPFAEIAFASGFRSIRRFNDAIRETYGRAPSELRRRSQEEQPMGAGALTLRLGYRPPYDWETILGYLGPRCIPGVEQVSRGHYRRSIRVEGRPAILDVSKARRGHALVLELAGLDKPVRLPTVVASVRRQFDLDADPADIRRIFTGDPELEPRLKQRTGLRIPGAWDPFELGVRAILGQQISVAGATTLAGRLAARFGEALPGAGSDAPEQLFPTPEMLADADVESIGLPRARAATVRTFAGAVASGEIVLDGSADPDQVYQAVCALPGIGDWTAQYLLLRGLGTPDAFPAGDLGLRKALGNGQPVPERAVAERAQAWRPWRGYAAMLLWNVSLPTTD